MTMQQRKRAYHGRRGPSPIVWLIAAVVLVAAIVLVVVGLTKKPAVLPAEDPDPVVDPATPETPDNTDANTPDSTDPDGTDPAQKPDDTQQPADNQPDDKTTTTASDEPYIDANGLLQFSTKGHYVQADSYQGGGEAPWNLLLVNDWNPLPSGYDSAVSFTTVSGGKQVDSRIIDAVNRMLNDASSYDLAVVSAYRPQEEQNTLYWRKVKQYTDKGVRNVLCTEISKDGTLQGPAIELYKEIMAAYPDLHLIASGGVSCNEDIDALETAGIPAVVFGKAFYEGKIDIDKLGL